MKRNINLKNIELLLFYFLIITGLGAVLFTIPFLRYPYDSIAHMIAIDEMYHGLEVTTTTIQQSRLIWHKLWASIFHLIHLDSTQFFLRAKIIHVAQTYMALFSIYYFSKVVIRNIFVNIPALTLKYLSFWSVVIWLTVYATFSVNYHMVWNLWYSLTYQITLPLFFYMTALTLVLFLETRNIYIKIFNTIQILLLSWFILLAHSMEFMYYLMYLFILLFLYSKKVFEIIKKYYKITLPSIALFLYLFFYVQPDDVLIFRYIANGSFKEIFYDSIEQGAVAVSHYNRASHAINELMYVIFYIGLATLSYYAIAFKKLHQTVNPKMFVFLLITSLFIFIPLYPFTAGLFALITKMHVVHRIYFASSLFVLLPVSIYFLMHRYTSKVHYMNLIILIVLISTYLYSTHTKTMHHNYHKNIQSIKNSFLNTYNFPLSQKDFDLIAKKIKIDQKHNHTKREIQYFARTDIAFVLKYVYGQKVYWLGRGTTINYKEIFQRYLQYYQYHMVLFSEEGLPPVPFYK